MTKVKPPRNARFLERERKARESELARIQFSLEFNTKALNRRIARLEKEGIPYINESGEYIDTACQDVSTAIETLKRQLGEMVTK